VLYGHSDGTNNSCYWIYLAVEIWLFYVLASCYFDDNGGGWVGSIPAKESSSSLSS